MFFFEFPVIRLHIWLVFDVPSATAIFRHDDPFGQRMVNGAPSLTWLSLSVKLRVLGLPALVVVLSKKFRHNIGN